MREEANVSVESIRRAQKITGELLWLAGRSRPDIACGVMKMSQRAVKSPEWTACLGNNILEYLHSTRNHGLCSVAPDEGAGSRPRDGSTLEVMVDVLFGLEMSGVSRGSLPCLLVVQSNGSVGNSPWCLSLRRRLS